MAVRDVPMSAEVYHAYEAYKEKMIRLASSMADRAEEVLKQDTLSALDIRLLKANAQMADEITLMVWDSMRF